MHCRNTQTRTANLQKFKLSLRLHQQQESQFGLKTRCVAGPESGLKTGGFVGPKNSTNEGT